MQLKNKIFINGIHEGRPDVLKLWNEAFGDDLRYLDFLFKSRLTEEKNICALIVGGELVSALALIKVPFNRNGEILISNYICYAATFKKYRGKGYMLELLRNVLALGGTFCLIPSNEKLFSYYSCLGFSPVLSVYTKKIKYLQEPEAVTLHRVSHDSFNLPEIYQIYYNKFCIEGSFYKDQSLFRKMIAESNYNEKSGGFFSDGKTFGFVSVKTGKTLIHEFFGSDIQAFSYAVAKKYHKDVIVDNNGYLPGAVKVKIGMVYESGRPVVPGYINQMFN